jgi:hypothetical protein
MERAASLAFYFRQFGQPSYPPVSPIWHLLRVLTTLVKLLTLPICTSARIATDILFKYRELSGDSFDMRLQKIGPATCHLATFEIHLQL